MAFLFVMAATLCAGASTPPPAGPSCTVNWATVYQEIDGFGGSDAFENAPMTSAQAELLFSVTKGVGLSLLRTEVPDDGSCTSVCAACSGTYQDMLLAQAYGVRIWSTPWSPPASMKTNNNVTNGGSLLSQDYGPYATYLSNYIKSVAQQGISLYALSVQNEPDQNRNYDSALWSAQNFHDFILNNLGPTLAANGQSGVKIIMPEPSGSGLLPGFANMTMQDPAAAAYVGIVAFHGYDNGTPGPYQYLGSAHLWETEDSGGSGFGQSLCGGCWDPSMADALMWVQIMHGWLVNGNVNAWNYWWLVGLDPDDNQGLINSNGDVSKFLYVMGNYSKFVRPGWHRIGATVNPQSGVRVSAYNNPPSGAFAIVAINTSSASLSQNFSLSGFSAGFVTPWVTSSTQNLAQQQNVSVSGGSFGYSLPAQSVTTFVGTNAPSVPVLPPSRWVLAVLAALVFLSASRYLTKTGKQSRI
jgi:glucuronoarabinoxylan endo-1,4-beta-xylanase